MNSQNATGLGAVALAVIIAIVVGFIQSNKAMRTYAVGQCMQAGMEEYSYPESNTKSTTPNRGAYEECMAEMGYTLVEK